jgi:hypothetical protein
MYFNVFEVLMVTLRNTAENALITLSVISIVLTAISASLGLWYELRAVVVMHITQDECDRLEAISPCNWCWQTACGGFVGTVVFGGLLVFLVA